MPPKPVKMNCSMTENARCEEVRWFEEYKDTIYLKIDSVEKSLMTLECHSLISEEDARAAWALVVASTKSSSLEAPPRRLGKEQRDPQAWL